MYRYRSCSVQHFEKLHSNFNFNSIPYENTKINLKLNIHCPSDRPNARWVLNYNYCLFA